MTSRRPGLLRTALVVMGAEMRELARSPGLYLFIPLIVIQVTGVSLSATGAFDTEVLATPGTIAARSFNTVTILSLLLLLFYFTESLWREHRWRVAPITNSTPASSAAMLLGKMAAILVAVEVPLLAGVIVAALVTLGIQAVMSSAGGGASLADLIAVGPFFRVWIPFLLPTVVLWMGFLALVWSVVRSRFAVYGIALAVLVGTGLLVQFDKTNWVSNWHLWSGVQWTDFGPFQLDRSALVLNRLFALSLAVLFTALALWIWPRRIQDPQSTLAAFRPARAWRTATWALLWALPALVLGTSLALEVRHGREGGILERRAKNYRRANVETWKDADQPAIKAIDAEVEIDPDASAFVVKGTYTLRNGHARALPRFAVTPGSTFEDLSWTIDGQAVADGDGVARNSAGLWEFTPREPIPPGGEVRLGFAYHGVQPQQPGRNPSGASEFILPAGVVLTAFSPSFLPVMGFVDGVGLGDGPPPEGKRPEPEAWRGVTPPLFGFGYDTMVRLAVTGPEDFRFNGPGVLLSDTVADGKRTMVWQTDAPVRIANLVGGRLVEHQGESTSIWHLPAHHWNLDDMQLALDSARHWYSEWFWPYPWKELRLTEFPGLAGYAQGF
ncbi:MAG: hypothetical protein KDA22_02130, partial [Phycisphaerales bacterium]|nr:hypothetical protein [Phycisphaerales bacterium]